MAERLNGKSLFIACVQLQGLGQRLLDEAPVASVVDQANGSVGPCWAVDEDCGDFQEYWALDLCAASCDGRGRTCCAR